MGTKLKELRDQKKLTQKEMADRLKCSETYYSLIETGKRNPSVNMAKRIGATLGVEWTLFFKSEDETNEKS